MKIVIILTKTISVQIFKMYLQVAEQLEHQIF